MLVRNQAIFECAFVDLGLMEEADVLDGKQTHANYLLNLSATIDQSDKDTVLHAAEFIAKSKINQYLQALATFQVLQGIFYVAPLYFSMRQPKELADFAWVIDGKNKNKADEWETWWSSHAPGVLSVMSRRQPRPEIAGADFSYMAKYKGIAKEKDGTKFKGTDMKMILSNLRFSSQSEIGLELVDILVNATRRALVGNLQMGGYQNIRNLMLHRKAEGALRLVNFTNRDDKAGWQEVRADWASVAKYFTAIGRKMFTENAIRKTYEIEQANKLESFNV